MKTLPHTKSFVNFKLLSFLFALTVVLHVVASAISLSHPRLYAFATLFETIGWISIGLIWVIALFKGIGSWVQKTWTRWMTVRRKKALKRAKKKDTFVSHLKTVVNFKLLSFLFILTIALHVVASAISLSHPRLHTLLTLFEIIGWISIGLIWVIALLKGIGSWVPKTWTRVWMAVRTKKAKTNDTFVSLEQLKSLSQDIQRLGLALHGTTPEVENARQMYFQALGGAVPTLILPPQNALLYAEFESLVKVLSHFGFPSLENVRLLQTDFAFIQQWGSDLERRHLQHQRRSSEQFAALRVALAMVAQQHQALGETCASAHHDPGYQRVKGALRFLEQMVNDQRCSSDFAQVWVQKLQSDMNTLLKQFAQALV